MTNVRAARLLGLGLVFMGTIGTVAALIGLMAGSDGTAAFPASVALGIVVIVTHRPQKRRRPRA